MSKPVTWTTVYVGSVDVLRRDVKSLLEEVIGSILDDEFDAFDSGSEIGYKEVSRIANCVLNNTDWSGVRGELDDFIDDYVCKAVKDGSYRSDFIFSVDQLSEARETKLWNILRDFVVECAHERNLPYTREKEMNKPKEDPCLTELKKMANNLGYILVRAK